MHELGLQDLIKRIGAEHVRRRLNDETEHEAQLFGQGTLFFNLENSLLAPGVIATALKVTGLYGRARQNADLVCIRRNELASTVLPKSFDGFTLLHISDLHADMSAGAMRRLPGMVADLAYDICVLTGDYRGQTFGPFDKSLDYIAPVIAALKPPVYGILGNHDTIRMTPALEGMGIRMLFNECEAIWRGDEAIYLAGVDDAHFYRADDIGKAAAPIPSDAFSILLSHTPEVYRAAAAAGFDLMLSGHTRWRPALPARRYRDQTGSVAAARVRQRRLALRQDGRLHLGRRRHQPAAGPPQLPGGDHAAHVATGGVTRRRASEREPIRLKRLRIGFTSPACWGGRRASAGWGSLRSGSPDAEAPPPQPSPQAGEGAQLHRGYGST